MLCLGRAEEIILENIKQYCVHLYVYAFKNHFEKHKS